MITDRADLDKMIDDIDPSKYSKTRNFLDGKVTMLSRYFTHGILNPADVISTIIAKHGADACGKLLSEFAWREYYQRVWQAREQSIFDDIKHDQSPVISGEIPEAVLEAETGIDVIDQAISELIETGYMHNHARMWLASIVVNLGQTNWRMPAKWLFYHLLDGDPASNTLSWQWIAGSFSHRKYIANQENLNRYSQTEQTDTFLDVSYEELAELEIPEVLKNRKTIDLANQYPESDSIELSGDDVILYSIWNLDPSWLKGSDAKRILLIEPSIYDEYPMSQKRWDFILHWARKIDGIELFVGELDQLFSDNYKGKIFYQEHPLTNHWPGERLARKWIFPDVEGYYPSFSKYWKLTQKKSPKP